MPNHTSQLRLGIDVGGTNTDAVVIDDSGTVLASVKTATTVEPIDGIREALDAVLAGVDRTRVTKAMLGTTHPANAIIQRRGLDRVGVLRLAAPSSLAVTPGRRLARRHPQLGDRPRRDHPGRQRVRRPRDRPARRGRVKRFAAECAWPPDATAISVAGAFSPAPTRPRVARRVS